MRQYPSTLLENAVNELSALPGIGRKTALRLALYMLRRDTDYTERLSTALLTLRRDVQYCRECHNICDSDHCAICSAPGRDHSTICVVENVKDVMAIENTAQFHGVYHVLGGIISPIDGIGPQDLTVKELLERLADTSIQEVLLATNPNVEGETTAVYLARLIKPLGIKTTRLASGLPVGGDLEFADEVTLARAIESRREL